MLAGWELQSEGDWQVDTFGGDPAQKRGSPGTEKQETRGAQLNPCQDSTCDGVCVVHFLSCTVRVTPFHSPPPTRVRATINLRGQQEMLEKH